MKDSMTTVTLRREDWEAIQLVLRLLRSVGSGYQIPSERHLRLIDEALSIKPVEEEVRSACCLATTTIFRDDPDILVCCKCGTRCSPVKSEEKKCEHDDGNYWFKPDGKYEINKHKKDFPVCPFCPKPEERSPEEIAKEILGECKCKEPSGGRGGSESFTCDLHIYGNEFIQAINNERQRNRGGGK